MTGSFHQHLINAISSINENIFDIERTSRLVCNNHLGSVITVLGNANRSLDYVQCRTLKICKTTFKIPEPIRCKIKFSK